MLKAFHYTHFPIELARHSPYTLERFEILREAVSTLPEFSQVSVSRGEPIDDRSLAAVHSAEYIDEIRSGYGEERARQLRFPWTANLFNRVSTSAGCAVAAAEEAYRSGLGVVLGGGAHHAFRSHGHGFCVFNDIVIAARHAIATGLSNRVGILDCDVHQGDGTASLTRGSSQIISCSIHGMNNFPFQKEQSHLDIALEDACGDQAYLAAVARGLDALVKEHECDFIIYIGGADPYLEDRLGKLKISAEALKQRDFLVGSRCYNEEIPLTLLYGGGYCDTPRKTVDIQLNTLREILRARQS